MIAQFYHDYQNTKQLEDILDEAIHQGIKSYFDNEELCSSILSDERIKLMGDLFIGMYTAELQMRWKQLDDKEDKNQKEYFHKRTIQGINTIAQMKEWASEYPPEIQRTIRFIGLKILDKDEPVETTHTILKICVSRRAPTNGACCNGT